MMMRKEEDEDDEGEDFDDEGEDDDIIRDCDPHLEVQGYSDNGARRGKTPTVKDDSRKNEDDDL